MTHTLVLRLQLCKDSCVINVGLEMVLILPVNHKVGL